MERLNPVKDEEGLFRNNSGAIINTNNEQRLMYRKAKKERDEIRKIVERLGTLEEEVARLKLLINN